jgi:8-oxo-dGTP pyrophosphatase MutT (NUDIX family)
MDKRHHIQRFILNVLMNNEYARFRDLRPPQVDSNLYSYHLKTLLKQHLITKTLSGYTLTASGLECVDRLSSKDAHVRVQPKIMTMIAVMNQHDELLVYTKERQPFIDQLTFPSGKLHMEDATILDAARREVHERTGLAATSPQHIGDIYMTITAEKRKIMSALIHVFLLQVVKEAIVLNKNTSWLPINDDIELAPASGHVRTLLREGDSGHFFREFSDEIR